MRTILVTSWLPRNAKSGVGTYMRKLSEFFRNDPDIRLTFLQVDDAPRAWRWIAGLARRIIRLAAFIDPKFIELSFEVRYRLLIRGALSRYRDHHFDLINAQDILSGYTAKKFFKNKTPLMLTCHFNGNPVEEDILRYGLKESARPYLERRYKRKFRAVDEFIFVAAYTKTTVGYLLPESARSRVIYNGLDFSRTFHRPAGIPGLSIVNTGHVEDRKNQKLFIPIAKELLRRKYEDFQITIVGHGPALDSLQDAVEKEGLTGHFQFTGWSNDVTRWLTGAHLYIHTSLHDTCPYSVVEAMAAGVPVLAFKVGGLPEMLPEDCLFAPNDHVAMVNYFLDNLEKLPAIGERQYDKAKTDFSDTVQVERLSAAWREL